VGIPTAIQLFLLTRKPDYGKGKCSLVVENPSNRLLLSWIANVARQKPFHHLQRRSSHLSCHRQDQPVGVVESLSLVEVVALEVVGVVVENPSAVGAVVAFSLASQVGWPPLMSPSSSPLTPFARALEHVFLQPPRGSWPASPVPTNPSWSATMPNKKVARAPYHYGQSPNPNNWHEAADALRQLKQSRQRRIANQALVKKVETIERLLKEKA